MKPKLTVVESHSEIANVEADPESPAPWLAWCLIAAAVLVGVMAALL